MKQIYRFRRALKTNLIIIFNKAIIIRNNKFFNQFQFLMGIKKKKKMIFFFYLANLRFYDKIYFDEVV